jgi:hypothetical protein
MHWKEFPAFHGLKGMQRYSNNQKRVIITVLAISVGLTEVDDNPP